MFCTNCGTQLPDEAKFCSNCGKPTHGTPSGSGLSESGDSGKSYDAPIINPATGTSVEVEPDWTSTEQDALPKQHIIWDEQKKELTEYAEQSITRLVNASLGSPLEAAVREAQAGDILRLKAGEHRLRRPLAVKKPLSLIGEGMDNTRVVCDGEECVVQLQQEGPFMLHDLSFEHEGSRRADVVQVAGGEIDIRRCRFRGGVDEAGGVVEAVCSCMDRPRA
jgi:zinc-ribbon domain